MSVGNALLLSAIPFDEVFDGQKHEHHAQPAATDSSARSKKDDTSEFDRAPRQKYQDRDPVKSAEQTRDIPTKHGAIK
jgi:hypothetical protein